jgi:hypothetical protein
MISRKHTQGSLMAALFNNRRYDVYNYAYEMPEFNRERLRKDFIGILEKYEVREDNKKEIAALLLSEAENAAHLFASNVAFSYADYVCDKTIYRRKERYEQ